MNYDETMEEFEPGILSTIHCEDAFGKENLEIELCKEVYGKYGTKPLVFRLTHNLGLVEANIWEEAYIVDQQYSHDVEEVCKKAAGIIEDHIIKIVIVDCLEELTAGASSGNRKDDITRITGSLHGLAKRWNVSVILLSEKSENDSHIELDTDKGSILEQIKNH